MQMAQRDARAFLGSGPVLHKAKRWVSYPTLFYRRVGIGAYARRALKGGTYCPVCIRLAFGMWIPRMLRVVKVDEKAGLKWPSSAIRT